MYSKNDYRNYLEHSWGKKPEQKAAEKAYNQKYYAENKSKWAQYRENAAKKIGIGYKDEIAKAREEEAYNREMANDYQSALDNVYDPRIRDTKGKIIDNRNAANKAWNDFRNAGGVKSGPFTSYNITSKSQTDSLLKAGQANKNADYNVEKLKGEKAAVNTVRRSKAKREAQANAASNRAHRLQQAYSKTPLGKAEGAVNKGKSFISNLVNKGKKFASDQRDKHTKIVDGAHTIKDYKNKNYSVSNEPESVESVGYRIHNGKVETGTTWKRGRKSYKTSDVVTVRKKKK